MRYLAVAHFKRQQHYRDRKPPWIKLYNDLLDSYEFTRLQDASKAHALLISLLASRHDNRLPDDAEWLGKSIHATEPIDIAALVNAGFLVVCDDASGTLAECSVSARPETEREGEAERETEEEQPPPPPTEAAPDGAAGAGVSLVRSGKPAGLTLRGVAAITAHVAESLAAADAALKTSEQRELRRLAGAEMVLAYHAHVFGLSPMITAEDKRIRLLARSQRENGDDLNELLYVIDGAKKDPHLNDPATRYAERIPTLFRDRAQIERLARLAPAFRRGDKHPVYVRYVLGAPVEGAEVVDLTAGGGS